MKIRHFPHFSLLKEIELDEHYSFENIRNRALKYANSHPQKFTITGDPGGPGLIVEKNFVDYYWKQIRKEIAEIYGEIERQERERTPKGNNSGFEVGAETSSKTDVPETKTRISTR